MVSYALGSTLFVLAMMALGLPVYIALCKDIDKLAEHNSGKPDERGLDDGEDEEYEEDEDSE